jgi:hypothetical protein
MTATRTEAAERAAARAVLLAAARPSSERCWFYWHSLGRPPVRCTVQPDHHEGAHRYA